MLVVIFIISGSNLSGRVGCGVVNPLLSTLDEQVNQYSALSVVSVSVLGRLHARALDSIRQFQGLCA